MHARSLCDKIIGHTGESPIRRVPVQQARRSDFDRGAQRQWLKALRPFRFNAGRPKCGPRSRRIRERYARSCARIAKILRMLRNFPRFAGFWFG